MIIAALLSLATTWILSSLSESARFITSESIA